MPGPWIFGYGSLIWRPAFAFERRVPAFVMGYMRRFWQASPDHRGTETETGRVVTLLEAPGERCHGMAYQLCVREAPAILEALDYRERAGYQRVFTSLHTEELGVIDDGLLYVADGKNPNYIGPASEEDIAAIIRRAHGPSGSNREYLLRLHQALGEMRAEDPHITKLASLVACSALPNV